MIFPTGKYRLRKPIIIVDKMTLALKTSYICSPGFLLLAVSNVEFAFNSNSITGVANLRLQKKNCAAVYT